MLAPGRYILDVFAHGAGEDVARCRWRLVARIQRTPGMREVLCLHEFEETFTYRTRRPLSLGVRDQWSGDQRTKLTPPPPCFSDTETIGEHVGSHVLLQEHIFGTCILY